VVFCDLEGEEMIVGFIIIVISGSIACCLDIMKIPLPPVIWYLWGAVSSVAAMWFFVV